MNQEEAINCTRNASCSAPAAYDEVSVVFSIVLAAVVLTTHILFGGALIVTYMIFKELRTFYGLLLVNLVVVVMLQSPLLLGFVIQAEIPELCQAFAILLHYFALVRSFSISALIFEAVTHFYSAFKVVPPKADEHPKRTLVKYLLVCWGIPLIILLVFVIVNYTVEDSIKYGETYGRCFLDALVPLIVGMMLPVFVPSIFNVLAGLFIAAVLLRNAHRSIKMSTSAFSLKAHRNDILRDIRIVFALFILTGVAWVLGAAALFGKSIWLDFAFVIFDTLQFIFLTLAYICTKKVFMLYKGFIRHRLPTKSQPASSNAV